MRYVNFVIICTVVYLVGRYTYMGIRFLVDRAFAWGAGLGREGK